MAKETQANGVQSVDSREQKIQQQNQILEAIRQKRQAISDRTTPKPFIERKGDGFDYVDEAYMRKQLNDFYPVWSWKIDKSDMLGSEWCIVTGTLSIVDAGVPRTFSSIGAARVQFKKGQPHSAENVVDIDKNVASANTNAFKRAINRLCNIADDVYQKQVKDISIGEDQKESIKAMMEGLDGKVQESILKGIEDQTINSENINPVIDKIKKLKIKTEKKEK
tara:strand:+ start:388 stop:1053 length:666 start_codon:yes stop_codon:yes gene_type:complete